MKYSSCANFTACHSTYMNFTWDFIDFALEFTLQFCAQYVTFLSTWSHCFSPHFSAVHNRYYAALQCTSFHTSGLTFNIALHNLQCIPYCTLHHTLHCTPQIALDCNLVLFAGHSLLFHFTCHISFHFMWYFLALHVPQNTTFHHNLHHTITYEILHTLPEP